MDHLITGADYLARHPGFTLVGRDAELRQLSSILLRANASSILLVGAGGVGCTAICLGLQAAKDAPGAPFDLARRRLRWLDVNGLFGAADDVAGRFQRVLARLAEIDGSILLVEDTRDLIEACRNAGTMHLLNALLGGVRGGRYQLILEARDEDLDQVLRTSSDARELLTVLPVEEPRGEALLAIARAAAPCLAAAHGGIAVADDAVAAAVELTTKHRPRDEATARAQPERAITLLDRALASYRLAAHADPRWDAPRARLAALYAERREGEAVVDRLQGEIAAIAARDGAAATDDLSPLRSTGADDLRRRLASVRTLLADNLAAAAEIEAGVNADLALTRDHVETELSVVLGVPVARLKQTDRERLMLLAGRLRARIFDQSEVIERVVNAVRVARVGRRTGAPVSFLFLGPSGVGKTELTLALAEYLFDDDAALTRFDMSEYMEKHAVARLIGAPPGYEGFATGGILTNVVRRRPAQVLLFDEIEKAHPDVFNVFLQVLSAGRLTDGLGRVANFESAVIVMTTNIGQAHFLAGGDDAPARVRAELAETYRTEFLNRFDGRENVLLFNVLSLDAIERIANRELDAVAATYGDRGVRLTVDDGAVAAFCRARYDPSVGARGLPALIRRHVEGPVVNRLLARPDAAGTVVVRWDDVSGLHVAFDDAVPDGPTWPGPHDPPFRPRGAFEGGRS